ncbi:hypothetical protein [Bosea sp. (in: a-proteobacteria)]|uniref:hypothetical protein n=1 Tax=Bosea sp. (in: a-proteobacteria) TaxID=1871050 RepID=UPI0027370F3F|nr:hypothetical protein [Bosea sp. (in: a-proteobacteria)]MDP3407625.1 hypothetical protein [Bosea sp. (in: a-proteobacteria)]
MPDRRDADRFRTVPIHVVLGALLGAATYLLIIAFDIGFLGGLLAAEAEQTQLFLVMLGIFAGHGAVGSGLTAFYLLAAQD